MQVFICQFAEVRALIILHRPKLELSHQLSECLSALHYGAGRARSPYQLLDER